MPSHNLHHIINVQFSRYIWALRAHLQFPRFHSEITSLFFEFRGCCQPVDPITESMDYTRSLSLARLIVFELFAQWNLPFRRFQSTNIFFKVVGQSGLEPPTSRLSVVCSSQLSYWPVWWRLAGSNRWPPACKAGALPAELNPHLFSLSAQSAPSKLNNVFMTSFPLYWP